MMNKPTLAVATLALLAACTTPPANPNAGPGATLASPQEAGTLFAQVCVANLPQFRSAPATLARLPFTQNSTTSTYYHNTLNLSVNLAQGDCSMVFFSNDSTPAEEFVTGAEQTGIQGSGDATFTVRQLNGLTVANIRLSPT